MMARGFKPVGWVAAVATAALGCYMLSLNVAAERAELASVEREIVATKQEIRSLQTELGTRGRLAQLDRWNADVLALSAPNSAQFLADEFTLARFDQRGKTIEEKTKVQMASAEAPQPQMKPEVAGVVHAAGETMPAKQPQHLVHQASLIMGGENAQLTMQRVPSSVQKAPPPAKKDAPSLQKTAAMSKMPVLVQKTSAPVRKAPPSARKDAPAAQKLASATSKLPLKATAAKKMVLLDDKLVAEIGATAKSEKKPKRNGEAQ